MKKTTILLVLIVIFGMGLLGFFAGKKLGGEKVEGELGALIDKVYPKPPEVIVSAGGIIKGIYGATITLEIIDPDDYLPHTDGSAHKKMTKFVTVGSETEILKIDYTNPQTDGSPTTTKLEISDLCEGEQIAIQTKNNLRTDKKVVAEEIKLIEY